MKSLVTFMKKKRLRKSSLALFIPLLSFAVVNTAHARTCEAVADVNFDNHSGNYRNYYLQDAQRNFGQLQSNAAAEVRGLNLRPTAANKKPDWNWQNQAGNGHIKIEIPKDKSSGLDSGMLFDQRFQKTDAAVMEYRVKFSKGFEWTKGGKLPGLAGQGSNANIPVGCTEKTNNIDNGFSSRIMWRENGRLVVYTYLPERKAIIKANKNTNKSNCGVDIPFFKNAQTDRWYTIRQSIKLNSVGKKDGYLKMEVDGKVALERDDIEFRIKKTVNINDFLFHIYRGGGQKSTQYYADKDGQIFIDDVKVWRDCETPDTQRNTKPSNEKPSRPGPIIQEISSNNDTLCSVASSNISTAKNLFAQKCSAYERADCDQVLIDKQNLWLCSSKTVEKSLPYGLPNSNGSILLQAEDYARALDTTNANLGKAYRQGSVDIETIGNDQTQFNVGWIKDSESLSFDFYSPAMANAKLDIRAASEVDTGLISLAIDGETIASNLSVTYTGGKHSFETQSVDIGNLLSGDHELTVLVESGRFNLDWLKITNTNIAAPQPNIVKPENSRCVQYNKGSRQEIVLDSGHCIDFPDDLTSKKLQVWDSDISRCDFRGTLSDGNKTVAVDSNYKQIIGFTGSRLMLEPSNTCNALKLRAF